MEIKRMRLADIKTADYNPRIDLQPGDPAFEKIAMSIREFGLVDPLVWNKRTGTLVGGHQRKKVLEYLGITEAEVSVVDIPLSKEKALNVMLNNEKASGDWDDAKLAELVEELQEEGLAALTGFDDTDIKELLDEAESIGGEGGYGDAADHAGALAERFIVPPFSVLDTRKGEWQSRKKHWEAMTGNLSETRDGEYGKVGGDSETIFTEINGGTSNFDPVLAEIMYKWFCPAGGRVLDPFAGEQTKGVVAGALGLQYTGIEIRPEQVEVNRAACEGYKCLYVCGDSNNINSLVKDAGYDFVFTSPPYYDLEVYSKEDMSALGTYEEFMRQYAAIFKACANKLKPGRFLAVKVGEIRDKKAGWYRNFIGDNIRVMLDAGLQYYNEIILVNAAGTAPLRANNSMKNRKVVKVHQNVLVFYRGDKLNIGEEFNNEFNDVFTTDGADDEPQD